VSIQRRSPPPIPPERIVIDLGGSSACSRPDRLVVELGIGPRKQREDAEIGVDLQHGQVERHRACILHDELQALAAFTLGSPNWREALRRPSVSCRTPMRRPASGSTYEDTRFAARAIRLKRSASLSGRSASPTAPTSNRLAGSADATPDRTGTRTQSSAGVRMMITVQLNEPVGV
jgi:hypothetical protein